MTYLPQLHRILVEGAARLERGEFEPSGEPAQRGGRFARALRRLKGHRLFIFAGVAVLLAGSAGGAIALLGQPSAPLNGKASIPAGSPASPLGAIRYNVSVTPDLTGGAVGWCISEREQSPSQIPFGNVAAMRTLLLDVRASLDAAVNREVGQGVVRLRGSSTPVTLTPARAQRIEAATDARVRRLLNGLTQPARVRRSASFQRPYRVLLAPLVSGRAAGGADFATSSCGHVSTSGNPFVGSEASSGGEVSATTASTIYLTTSQVAAVRISPSLTVFTRAEHQLPDGYRIAVVVRETPPHRPTVPGLSGGRTPTALDRQGNPIAVHSSTVTANEPAVFWQRSPMRSRVPTSPPAAACEISTSALPGVELFSGQIVEHLRGFPQLTSKTFLSCADIEFVYDGEGIQAAILLDAQHPGTPPAPLPDSTQITRQPQTLNEAAIRGSGTQFVPQAVAGSGTPFITGRRVGNAWLVVESTSPLAQRLAVLNRLGTCVSTAGTCSPP